MCVRVCVCVFCGGYLFVDRNFVARKHTHTHTFAHYNDHDDDGDINVCEYLNMSTIYVVIITRWL